jgi:diacylglycerol O-acyltransferase / wax synthase
MKRLNGWDATLLYSETPNVHMHTLKIGIVDASHFEGDFTFELFRNTFRRRLHLLKPFRYRLVDIPYKLHHPMWLENCEVDLDYHLRAVRVPAPGGRRELDQVVGEIASRPLDRTRPLWEFYFADGLAGDRVAIIGKVHHALADGVASANLMARALDTSAPEEREPDIADQPPSPGYLLRAARRDHLRQLAELPQLIRETGAGVARVRRRAQERGEQHAFARRFHAPATFLNHVTPPARRFATATLSLTDFKQTGKHLGVTINDLVLSTASGALRELMLRYDGRADRPLVASVPVSVSTSPHRLSGNEVSGISVSLPVNVGDPLKRVRLTRMSAQIVKEELQLLGPSLIPRWAAYLPPAVAPPAFRYLAGRDSRHRALNVTISNVAGPREQIRLAGAVLSEIYSVGPLVSGAGMNITVWSYADQLNVSVLTDDLTLTDPHEATDALIHAFSEIRVAAGFPAAVAEVANVMAPASALS